MSQLRARSLFPAVTVLIALLLVITLAGGCSNAQDASAPEAQATIGALATSNAQLSTRVAELSAQAAPPPATPQPAAEPAGQETQGAPPQPALEPQQETEAPPQAEAQGAAAQDAAAPQTAETGPLPKLLISLGLAPEGETLFDMRLDRATNHLFVTDSSNQLHVIDATTYMPLQTLPFGGFLQLDSDHNRLYVYKPFVNEGEESLIRILDTQTLAEVGTLAGAAIAVDSVNQRLFVGEPYGISTPEDAPGVRIVDGATLEVTGSFTQTGAPVYNPRRDELLIVAYTVYSADPATQQVTADLFPQLTDIGENGFLWCNGCAWVDGVTYYEAEQLVAVAVSAHCAGKGCGAVEPPRFFDANTMQEIDPATAPEVQAACGSQSEPAGAIAGKRYVNQVYDRYVVFTNLLVTDAQGTPLTLRDGLRIDHRNERTGQGYLYDGTVLDLASLTPVGRWPAACIFATEAGEGLIFGRRANSLYVIAEQGGTLSAPEPALPEMLPQEWPIRQLAASPNFAADNTLLAVSGGGIYRSTDGGQHWQRLQGGLPQGQGSNWRVAFSPAYAADQTIFAGGDRGESWGEGVWRSQDGGNTWQAEWTDLQHRRITDFYFSPDYGANGAMVVQAQFYDVASGVAGNSYQQSLDGGVTWSLVVTGSAAAAGGQTPLPPVSELLPGYTPPPALPARVMAAGNGIEVTVDGSGWTTATAALPEGDLLFSLLPAPGYPSTPVLYAFGNKSIWRSEDNGLTWSNWDDPRPAGLDAASHMSTAALSPQLADGTHRLFVGTANGQVWVLDPAEMAWRLASAPAAAQAAAQAPSPLAIATATPQAATPAAALTATTTGTVTAAAGTATPAAAAPAPTSQAETAAGAAPTVGAEPLAGEPPAGLFRPEGTTGLFWQNNTRAQQDLGWARQVGPSATGGAYQQFEHGTMVWRADTSQIFVFFDDGTWRAFADTFQEGDPESDPSFVPPAGRQQPIRGFGKVWREHADVREKLGWATAKEMAQNAEIHLFERGAMLRYGPLLFIAVGADVDGGVNRGAWY